MKEVEAHQKVTAKDTAIIAAMAQSVYFADGAYFRDKAMERHVFRNTIAKELGIYSEYEQLKPYYREIQEFNKKREAKLSDLYTLYLKTNNKEDAYRKAAEDTDYFFEQILGKSLYSDFKLAIDVITKRMNLLRSLM